MAKVPGSIFRRTLFWAHLSCGVTAGILIFIMSITGALLAYERQIVESRAAANRVALSKEAAGLSADQLIEKARAAAPQSAQLNLVFDTDPTRPVSATFGRQEILLHPQSGAVLADATANTKSFFRIVENVHRWLGGDARGTGADLMHLANLLFMFIVVSGVYLWLPAAWNWPILRGRMLFRTSYVNSKVRDYNWHHAFSFWVFIPLFLIAMSGVVMSYPWANTLLFSIYGEQPPPQRQGPPGGPGAGMNGPERNGPDADDATTQHVSAQQLLDVARSTFVDWQRITLPANIRGKSIDLTAELKSAEARTPRQTLTLSTLDASVIRLAAPSPGQGNSQSPGQRARGWIRFVHTGEQYGVTGQTVAAIASLAACFLAYTGIALAWRRLIAPLYQRS